MNTVIELKTNKKNISICICLVIFLSKNGHASELYFPPELLSVGGQPVASLSHFQGGGNQQPDEYKVDLYLNQQFIVSRTVNFVIKESSTDTPPSPAGRADNTGLMPCLSRKDLLELGVKVGDYPALAAAGNEGCINLAQSVPGAFGYFDFTKMRLYISIPQAALHSTARGYIDPELWDEGISAAMVSYHFSGSNSRTDSSDSDSYYLNLTSGLNAGAWRLRDYRIWNYYRNKYSSKQQWQRVKTYVERSIIPLRSALTVGESTTSSDIFDSLSFRGIQLGTEDNMYPDTHRGYAPTIRGVAESNAQVSIRQNGYNVYQTTVSPGAFEINDLYPMYSSGDLEVLVREANGTTRVFTVPYSSVPNLRREGRLKYSLTAGKYLNSSNQYEEPTFAQGAMLWGLPYGITAYGGMQYSDHYLAAQTGAGFNIGSLGAVSVDVTHADSTLADGSKRQGQSVRFLYAHSLNTVGTTFRLTGYRYSTKGFHTLDETALKRMSGRLYEQDVYDESGELIKDHYTDYYSLYNTRRARLEANISQRIGEIGSLYMSGVRQTYWGTSNTNNSVQTGFSSSIGPVNYSLSYGYTRQTQNNAPSYNERTANLSISLPLGRLLSPGSQTSSLYATANAIRNNQGSTSFQSGLSGSMLENNNLSWNVSQGHESRQGYSGNTGLSYKGSRGNTSAGYSYGQNYRKVSYGLNGSALLHGEGLTLGQPITDGAVLIAAPGASGVNLKNEKGVKTDSRGYAIKSYATPYRENRVSLDVSKLDDKTEIENAVTRLVPTKGAITKANFNVHSGHRVIMTLLNKGQPVPFGSVVSSDGYSSIVGDDGKVFLSGMKDSGVVKVQWGSKNAEQCQASYNISNPHSETGIVNISGECE